MRFVASVTRQKMVTQFFLCCPCCKLNTQFTCLLKLSGSEGLFSAGRTPSKGVEQRCDRVGGTSSFADNPICTPCIYILSFPHLGCICFSVDILFMLTFVKKLFFFF